jgi:hypothetical protein
MAQRIDMAASQLQVRTLLVQLGGDPHQGAMI